MGIGQYINTFTPYNVTPYLNFGGAYNSSAKTESQEDAEKRRKKEEAEKAKAEFLKRMEEFEQKRIQEEKAIIDSPLTKDEIQALRDEGLQFEEDEIKKSEGSLAASMLFTTPFLLPTVKSAIKPKKNTIKMFYKEGAAHMDLFKKNPDLMTNAQETMQKLERKFAKDFRVAKGNPTLMKNIVDERILFRNTMQKALNSNNPQEIAMATEQCNVAKKVKNGIFSRWYRKFKNKPLYNSRFDAITTAENAGKFASVKPPKAGNSFFKNMFSNKLTWIMTAGMAVVPVILDWGNIKKAKEIDNQNAQNGKSTNYGNKQILQTSIKGAASALTYSITDTLARTVTKKALGNLAARVATNIALKGGCKILGSAIGSIIPGLGTAIGLIAGTAADYLLNKYVFGNMDFFKNTSIKQAELESSDDKKLLGQISELYSMGNNIHNPKVLDLIKRKYSSEDFEKIEQMHNMTEDERNAYLTKLAEEEQALIAQQQAQKQQS